MSSRQEVASKPVVAQWENHSLGVLRKPSHGRRAGCKPIVARCNVERAAIGEAGQCHAQMLKESARINAPDVKR